MTRSPNSRPLSELFFGYFRVNYATGADLRVDEHRLRHAAFVEEHGWLTAESCKPGLEYDAFDPFSCSVLLTDAGSGAPAACQRLILPERLPRELRTNVEQECRPLDSAFTFAALPRHSWAEASRLTIAPPFRGGRDTSRHSFRAVSYASLALAVALDRRLLFTLSDPRTPRLTQRLGFEMHQVGEVVDFHGPRAVFRIDIPEVVASVPDAARREVQRLVELARRAVIRTAVPAHDSPNAA